MYGLLITARMNERLHNAVHRCRWRLDPLCVLLQTIRQPRCMGCFYLRPVIDVLNCPLWLVRLARTGWFHVIRARSLSLSLDDDKKIRSTVSSSKIAPANFAETAFARPSPPSDDSSMKIRKDRIPLFEEIENSGVEDNNRAKRRNSRL